MRTADQALRFAEPWLGLVVELLKSRLAGVGWSRRQKQRCLIATLQLLLALQTIARFTTAAERRGVLRNNSGT